MDVHHTQHQYTANIALLDTSEHTQHLYTANIDYWAHQNTPNTSTQLILTTGHIRTHPTPVHR